MENNFSNQKIDELIAKPKKIDKNFEKEKNMTTDANIDTIKSDFLDLKKEFESFKNEQQFKMLEFLGIFSGILSFILITSNIMINNKLDILSISLLFIGFSLSLIIFITGIKFLVIESNFKLHLIFTVLTVIIFSLLITINFKDIKNINSKTDSKIEINTKELKIQLEPSP